MAHFRWHTSDGTPQMAHLRWHTSELLYFILRLIILINFIKLYCVLLCCTSGCIVNIPGMNHDQVNFKIFTQNQPFLRYKYFVMQPPNTKFSPHSQIPPPPSTALPFTFTLLHPHSSKLISTSIYQKDKRG